VFDAGGDVDGVTDQREVEFACAADGSGDHEAGVDSDADAKFAAESIATMVRAAVST
jgi:hypothetical protein